MLQIKNICLIILLILSFAYCLTAGAKRYADDIEWVLEDALEDEFVVLELSEVVTPGDFRNAVKYYKKGEYCQAVVILEKLLKLNLPDERNDFMALMAAECYRKLEMREKSSALYWYIIKRFPKSDKATAAYFRILQYAYIDKNDSLANDILGAFEKSHKLHPLYNSVLYLIGKLCFQLERYGEAESILRKIPDNSCRHFQAQFLAALSLFQLREADKALLILDYILKNTPDSDLITNVNIVMGDIYFTKENYKTALSYYRDIPNNTSRYNYVQVKMAHIYLKQKQYQKARDIAKPFINKLNQTNYFFEMASILEEVYKARDERIKAAKVKRLVNEQNMNVRLSFEINDELVRIYKMIRSWKLIKYNALEKRDDELIKCADKNINSVQDIKKKCLEILYEIGIISQKDSEGEVPGLAQQRYTMQLKNKIAATEVAFMDTKRDLQKNSSELKKNKKDSLLLIERTKIENRIDSISIDLEGVKCEYEKLKKTYLESGSEANNFGREMQAKYIDWAFLRYSEKKKELKNINKELASRYHKTQDSTLKDSLPGTDSKVDVVSLFTTIDKDKLVKSIKDDRIRLIDHIEMLVDANPGSSYNPQILFRLAELYYDISSEDFNRRLEEYEKQIEIESDSSGVEFPEYNLEETINVYNTIIDNCPNSWIADDAVFYKALALQKLGYEEEANDNLLKLIKEYPESEYYVEANMNIGSYFFRHPKIEGGKGYTLAEDAYRRVLNYPEHPQFVYAIYHLGWCYYMKDNYNDAIAVFKYLIEKVDLDFDMVHIDDKQIINPLMREEAIDYIAISFDEQKKVDDAIKFLTLIGNIDYAAKVFKRIGELREEDLDYKTAIEIYRRLINEYALSSIAPDAAKDLIKILESNNRHKEAMLEREKFFKRYARGSEWYSENVKKDSSRIPFIDSMNISIGLYVADAFYREAEKQGNIALYKRAVDNYGRLVAAYPENPTASEAQWNLAVILDKKLNKKTKAYEMYINYSRFTKAELERREQAALNAVAIAQRLLPPDSLIKPGNMEDSALKVIKAVKNYMELFPEGKAFADVAITMGSIYFNRKMYSNAIAAYKLNIKRGVKDPGYYNAGFLIAQCYFGEENWTKAAECFEKVWKESSDELQREKAYKLLLQSKFLLAKQLFDAGAFGKAAIAYRNIDREYSGSEYGDKTLFNAAEAFERGKKWIKACKMYFELFEKYPDSKLAPDALFNAASNYEKIKKFDKAAEMYELIISEYPTSVKAKDALFNVGFSYEKLGELEKMAEANERFSRLYPGEKDVELMLLRSAKYYFETSMYEKAERVYKNYISRYPNSEHSVEAYFMIGKCNFKSNYITNAISFFEQAEEQNKRLFLSGLKAGNYYAAEAAFSIGTIEKEKYNAINFKVPTKEIEKNRKIKAELLSSAAKGFQRVMEYKSERMFEAAFYIGEMYGEYAEAWSDQTLEKMNPIKQAVAKKDINLTSSEMMRKSYMPLKKVIELASSIDSLGPEAQKWVDSAKTKLAENYLKAGQYKRDAIVAMLQAPIPDEIKKQPLYLFQYKKQLLETLEPLKIKTRDSYLKSFKELKEIGILKEAEKEFFNKFGKTTFLIPDEYYKLANDILAGIDDLPKRLEEEEREELTFQFEDMAFELQDKAFFSFEKALEIAKQENLSGTIWYSKIMERLARLSPETYGKSFYKVEIVETNEEWVVHTDSVKYWNSFDPYGFGWQQVSIVSNKPCTSFIKGKPDIIWGNENSYHIYLWKNVFLNGVPMEGTIYLACSGKYKLYINEQLLSADSSETRELGVIDSIIGIKSLLKGGDNIIALELEDKNTVQRGIALVFYALIDTTQNFKSSAMPPKVKIVKKSDLLKETSINTIDSTVSTDSTTVTAPDSIVQKPKQTSYIQQFKNRGEIRNAILVYQERTVKAEEKMKKERLDVNKLHIKINTINKDILSIKKEIEHLKKLKKSMTREK